VDQTNLLKVNALPDPDFKYFSKAKALYLSVNTMCVINSKGKRDDVYNTSFLLCLFILSSRLLVQPV